jgi:hypothetical protein
MRSNVEGSSVKAQQTLTIALDEASRFNAMESCHIKLENHEVIYAGEARIKTILNVDETSVKFGENPRMSGAGATGAEVHCVPVFSHRRQGSGSKSRFRGATSWFDHRPQEDVDRDRLAEW